MRTNYILNTVGTILSLSLVLSSARCLWKRKAWWWVGRGCRCSSAAVRTRNPAWSWLGLPWSLGVLILYSSGRSGEHLRVWACDGIVEVHTNVVHL